MTELAAFTSIRFETDVGSRTEQVAMTSVFLGGATGSNDPVQVGLAGATISGDRALAFRDDGLLVHMDNADTTRALAYAGISLGAATAGTTVQFKKSGLITANFWSWVAGPVFVGGDGQLTQSAPSSGVLLAIGWAVDATSIDLKPGNPIKRS